MRTQYALPSNAGFAGARIPRVRACFLVFSVQNGLQSGHYGVAVQFRQVAAGVSRRPSGGPSGRAERIREGRLSDVERQAPGAAFFRRTVRSGSGFQPAMMRAHSRAWALVSMPGKRRRSSTAADSSPRCS